MKEMIIRLLLGTAIAAALVPVGLRAQASSGGDPLATVAADNGGTARMADRSRPSRDLAAARRATAPFHNVEQARAAGYPEDVTGCLDFPDGYLDFGPGAMGTHWLNFDYYRDGGALDPAKPEALLYEPRADGALRLVAVEYIIPEADRPRTAPPPVLFGRELQFHPQFGAWALHVWLWTHNDYGLFADVNPDVTCAFAERSGGDGAHRHR